MKSISIVIPNFNDSRIKRTIDSIIKQDFDDYEIIVVEGCVNNTKTKSIYEIFHTKIDLLIHESDEGIFDALNKGIKKTNGNLIFLIGADDVLSDNECFSSVWGIFQKYPDSDGISLGCRFVDSDDRIIRKWHINKVSSGKMKWGIMPPHFSLFLKKQLYHEIGLFDFEKSYVASDTEWLLRLASKREVKIPVLDNHYVDMEYGGASTGSFIYVLNAIIVIGKAAKKHKIKQWPLTPIIKLGSKLLQLKVKTKIKS